MERDMQWQKRGLSIKMNDNTEHEFEGGYVVAWIVAACIFGVGMFFGWCIADWIKV